MGVAGNAAAWTLSKSYRSRSTTANCGRASTAIRSPSTTMGCVCVDVGFIVYNELDYPDLAALFAHPGVETIESCMSFAVTADADRASVRSSARSATQADAQAAARQDVMEFAAVDL